MEYNCKIIEYANGTTQVRLFSNPIEYNYIDDKKNNKNNDKVFNPFTNKTEHIKEFNDDDNYNNLRSYKRCIQALYDYAKNYNWDYFVTLTLSADKIDRYNYELCSKTVRKWFNHLRAKCPNIKYLVVPEQHQDGAWHFHGLLADCPELVLVDSGHKINGQTIYNIKSYKLGFSNVTKVKDTKRIASYIGKYITKDLCENTKHKQRYFVSQNVPKPEVKLTSLVLSDTSYDDIIMRIADSMGKDITFAKEIKGDIINRTFIYELE